MELGSARVLLTPLSLDLHSMAKKQRRESARKRDADMLTWDVVEQTSRWASLMADVEGNVKGGRKRIQVEEVTSSADADAALLMPRRRAPDFPKLDLLAPLLVPHSCPSSQVLSMASEGRPIYVPDPSLALPPSPPRSKPNRKLHLPVPSFFVRSEAEAHSVQLQRACYSQPTALIQGLAGSVGMDLSLYSTKSLVATAPEQRVEVRSQRRMGAELNVDPETGEASWFCRSARSHLNIRDFAAYQAQSNLNECEDKLFKRPARSSDSSDSPGAAAAAAAAAAFPAIKFGTNIDLSDPLVWGAQLAEIGKLPDFLNLHSPANLLSHLGHEVLGMNTVQLYIKVPGCRTPGHQENLNFASVNVNIGPGECIWVVVDNDYWGAIAKMCRERGMDYLKGSWWPNVSDLVEAGIPYYFYRQRAGEVVWIGPGAVHWVQAEGHCVNIAWNTGLLDARQFHLAVQRYEWNKANKYKSIVPLLQLAWRLAANLVSSPKARVEDPGLWGRLREILLKSLHFQRRCVWLLASLGKGVQEHPWKAGDPAPYCKRCDEEVFNVLLVKMDEAGENWVFCFHCALRAAPDLSDFSALQQFPLAQLGATADAFAARQRLLRS